MMRVLAVADSFVTEADFQSELEGLGDAVSWRVVTLDERRVWTPRTPAEALLREHAGSPEQLVEALDGEDVLLVHVAPVTEAVLAAAPNLKMVGCARGGPVNVDVRAASARGIPVVGVPGRNTQAVAELTIALMVNVVRQVPRAMAAARASTTLGRSPIEGAPFMGTELAGKTLGLVGLGRVGSRVASHAGALGMRVLASDPYARPEQAASCGAELVALDELLSRSDIISLHARATPENRHMIGERELGLMRAGSYLVNTARETLVDEAALLAALRSGRLAGAAVDVVQPAGDRPHPLTELENVIVLPHIGGATREASRNGTRELARAVARLAAGEPLPNVVNQEALAAQRPDTPRGAPEVA